MNRYMVLIGVLLTSAPVLAAPPDLRPGLWQTRHTMTSESGQAEAAMAQMAASLAQMQEQLANMPPEQRQYMEEMMAEMGSFTPTGGESKECISAEDLAGEDWILEFEDCTNTVLERSAKRLHLRFDCRDEDGSRLRGETDMRFPSPTRYTGTATINVNYEGHSDRVSMQLSGEWLSADCGNYQSGRSDD